MRKIHKIREMAKKLFYLFMVLAVAVACNNQQPNAENSEVIDEITELTVANFTEMAQTLAGKQIVIKGTVSHTCKHGGKRMFLIDEGTEESVKVEAGENIASFDAELEGSDVIVTGILTELIVDETYLNNWENEVMAESGDEYKIHDGNHEGEHGEETEIAEGTEEGSEEDVAAEGETEEDHHGTDLEQIENLRNTLKESGKNHLSFYSINCISYEVAPPSPPSAE